MGQLSEDDAKAQWEAYSTPAFTYLKMKNNADLILSDIDEAKNKLLEMKADNNTVKLYITIDEKEKS
jgi:hypothetical protein